VRLYNYGMVPPVFVIGMLLYPRIMGVAYHVVQVINDGHNSANDVSIYVAFINVLIPNNKNVYVLTATPLVNQMNVFNVNQVFMH
jgi:hypothetical protein